ncbi:MAG: hypothetical protein ACLFN4_03495 [Candidatus Acetothermia bacterium]
MQITKSNQPEYNLWEGELQFDFAQCCQTQGQMNDLFPEWSCAQCLAICSTKGARDVKSVETFEHEAKKLLKTS